MDPKQNGIVKAALQGEEAQPHQQPLETITLKYNAATQDYTWQCDNVALVDAVQRLGLFQLLMFEYLRELNKQHVASAEQQ